jgi:tetratricopeptide (TPR) repeat protein
VCPTDALYFGFGRPAIGVPRVPAKHHPLTWGEEVAALAVFAASFWAVRDVYQLVPMLMALGTAAITAFLAVTTAKMLRAKELNFYRYDLKAAGRLRPAGWAFAAFALLWIGVNAHSGFIHHHESAGARAFQRIQVPDELALARADPAAWLSPADQANIASGKRHFRLASEGGLFVNNAALPKAAWLEYLSGNAAGAVDLLAAAAARERGQARALSLYYRGAILNRLGRNAEALASLDEALAERSDLVLAREEKGEALWRLGRSEEAIATWKAAVAANPGLPVATNLLAGAAWSLGRPEAAIPLERRADQATPADPFFHSMVGLRLQGVGMMGLAEKHFRRAVELDPLFRSRLDSIVRR